MKVKKLLALVLCLTTVCGSMLSSGCNFFQSSSSTDSSIEDSSSTYSSSEEDSSSSEDDSSSSAEEEEKETWYEERSGYKFCGYYKDRNFKYPATEIVTEETADNYYAKYQLDKVQQANCVPTELDYTIYAHDAIGAWTMYMSDVCGFYDLSLSNAETDFESYGLPYTWEDILNDNGGAGLHEGMVDNSQTWPADYHQRIPHYTEYGYDNLYTRNNTWSAYIAGDDVKVTTDAWVYTIVEGLYVAVVGCAVGGSMSFDKATIPSVIDGYPVKEVCLTNNNQRFSGETGIPQVGTLTIPSSVENVRIMFTSDVQEFPLQNLVLEEGIKTVRISSYAAKNVSIPASAWYVDVNYGTASNNMYYNGAEQTFTVAEGGHYYTENGCLYSKEGDLVYQFADKKNPELRISENAKRVLPFSLTGVAKNVYIPEGLEYFDWSAFISSARVAWLSTMTEAERIGYVPVFFIDSPKVVRQMMTDVVVDVVYNFMQNLDYKFPVMLFSDNVDMTPIWEEVEAMIHMEFAPFSSSIDEEIAYVKALLQDSGVEGYHVWATVGISENYLRVDGNALYATLRNESNEKQEYLLTYLDYTNVTDYSFDGVFERYL